ncbi:right-handed parallel beta-helix repeat-containing protein [Advenella kashmirensis]
MKKSSLYSLFTSVILLFPVAAYATPPINIYVIPDYLKTSKPSEKVLTVTSLEEARKLLNKRNDLTSSSIINILFASGVHKGDAVAWNLNLNGAQVNFSPIDNSTGAVIFDGKGSRLPTFFTARIPKKNDESLTNSNLHFKNFTIRNYCQGINLAGNSRSSKFADLENNSIKQMKFLNIGSKFDPVVKGNKPVGKCVAAVRLVHASNTVIMNNEFNNIINLDKSLTSLNRYGPEHLHAIYLADDSNDNQISNNIFKVFSGSPIRVRNASHNTVVENNSFSTPADYNVKQGAVSQWFCDPLAKIPCKNKAESPSDNIIMRDNKTDNKLELYRNLPQR